MSIVGILPKAPRVTRRYALNWIGIWLVLAITSWFCRPLLPYQELGISASSWEMFHSQNFLFTTINDRFNDEGSLLISWLENGIWSLFGVSEFSIRFLFSLFSIGTLFLTALAARQLWPNSPKVRANAPLILIGSLMWSVFSTAHIEQIFVAFFALLYMNFFIRAWKYHAKWWIVVGITQFISFFISGFGILIYLLPVSIFAPLWSKQYLKIYSYTAITSILAILLYTLWGLWIVQSYPFLSFIEVTGVSRFISQISDPVPFGTTLLILIIILFPWVLWFPIYRFFIVADKSEIGFRFCAVWFLTTLFAVLLTMKSSLTPLIPIYPAFCLLIARIYKSEVNTSKDISLVCLTILFIGVILAIAPLTVKWWGGDYHLTWIRALSPFWGIGLIVFSIVFLIYAKETRLVTLALMSVALTVAVNFGIIRNARSFYDVAPISERISWYQSKTYPMAHFGRYLGQYHFLGRLVNPITEIRHENEFAAFKYQYPNGRIIVYFDELTPSIKEISEYYQPFRNRYLAVFAVSDIDNINLLINE